MSKTALIVEDTDANRDFFERLLTQAGFDVTSACTGKEALATISTIDRLDMAVVDMEMPDCSGLHLITQLHKSHPNTFTIIATMHDERHLMESAFNKGCNLFLVKPHGFMDLFQLVTQNDLETLSARPAHVLDQYGLRPFHTNNNASLAD